MNKLTWTIIRTVMFYIIGLMNTVLIRTEDIGTWKNYAGYLFLLVAAVDTFFLIKKLIHKEKQNS